MTKNVFLSFYCNIFLSQYCVQKYCVWIEYDEQNLLNGHKWSLFSEDHHQYDHFLIFYNLHSGALLKQGCHSSETGFKFVSFYPLIFLYFYCTFNVFNFLQPSVMFASLAGLSSIHTVWEKVICDSDKLVFYFFFCLLICMYDWFCLFVC